MSEQSSFIDGFPDGASTNFLQVTLRSWPSAFHCRNLRHQALKSLVRLLLRLLTRPSIHSRFFCPCSAGDISVLANCKSLAQFAAVETAVTGKNVLASFFCGPIR